MLISWVAEAIQDAPEFTHRAREAAKVVGESIIPYLPSQFHLEYQPPAELAEKFRGLGSWLAARQFAIFEILFNIGEASLLLIRKVAYGEYDWIQGNAIETLVRLAARGVEPEQTIAKLKSKLSEMRWEAIAYAAGPLLHHASEDEAIRQLVAELMEIQDFREVVEDLRREESGQPSSD